MADIQFQEPQYGRSAISGPARSWLTNLVISTGLAKDAAGAQKVLVVILILAILGIIAVVASAGGASPEIPEPV